MPLSEREDAAGGSGLLASGGPLFGVARVFANNDTVALTGTADYFDMYFSEREQLAYCRVAGSAQIFGMPTLVDRPQEFTNKVPTNPTGDPLCTDFSQSAGFLYTTGAGGLIRGSSVDPATCAYTDLTANLPRVAVGVTSVTNQIAIITQSVGEIDVSLDGGLTFPTTVTGYGDIDHSGFIPFQSPNGSVACLNNAAESFFVRDLTVAVASQPSAALGFIPTHGAFNTDGSIFVCAGGTEFGGVFVVSDTTVGTFAEVPDAGNPFKFGSGSAANSGQTIDSIVYSAELGGWIILSASTFGGVGFLSENDLTTIIPGVWNDANAIANIMTNGAADSSGNVVVSGLDMRQFRLITG